MHQAHRTNRTLKAIALATLMHETGVRFDDAVQVPVGLGPFWAQLVKAAGRKGQLSEETRREWRKGQLSEETRRESLYYLKALECRRSHLVS